MLTWTTLLVPVLVTGIASYGVCKGVDIYDALLVGAKRGLEILVGILPALICLLTAVSVFRVSGAVAGLEGLLAPVLAVFAIPPETVGLMLTRPLSGSAALGVAAELIQVHGVDSYIGRCAAVMLGSTETTFYTIAVYFGAANIQETRYAIPAALCADITGFVAAAFAVRLCFPV